MYEERFYRRWVLNSEKFKTFEVKYKQSDICVSVDAASYFSKLPEIMLLCLKQFYSQIEDYTLTDVKFKTTLGSYSKEGAYAPIVKDMMKASLRVGVGPMACVAGAIAQYVGEAVLKNHDVKELYIENGGDVFISSDKNVRAFLYAGLNSKFSKIRLEVQNPGSSFAVCSSSGSFGHALSFGKADAVMVVCKSAILSDAFATRFCNDVHTEDDVQGVLTSSLQYEEILGIACACKNKFGLRGNLAMVS